MVSKLHAKKAPGELRKDDADRWLCTAAKGCDELAVVQKAVPCPGCDLCETAHTHPVMACAQHEAELEKYAAA